MSVSSTHARAILVRHLTFPLFTFGPGALALALLGGGHGSSRPSLPVLAGCGAIIVVSYALLHLLERLHPHREAWNQDHDDTRTDVAYLVAVGPVSAAIGGALATLASLSVHLACPDAFRTDLWPSALHPAVQVLVALVLAEFGHYWLHRLGHERPLLWRLHSVHHSAERLYWMNATRFHPLDLMLVAFAQVLPLELLGIPAPIYIAYAVVSSVYGQLQHCNVDLDSRLFRGFFATPELHRWHHSKDPREGDSNYGAILLLWDQLFGSVFWPGRPITDDIGIGAMPHFPKSLAAQLASPFGRLWKTAREDRPQ